MARNLGDYNLIRKIPNVSLTAYYYPPKKEKDIDNLIVEKGLDGNTLRSPSEIKALYGNDYLNKTNFIEDEPIMFSYKDGTEDVYTKSGYEHEFFEYQDRQFTQKRKYRIQVNDTHIEFMAGGKIQIPGEEPYILIKVINMTNDVSTQNIYKVLNGFQRGNGELKKAWQLAPKILALV